MSRKTVTAFCAALPGATVSETFGPGHDVWKVGGKIFAISGDGVAVKTDGIETAEALIAAGIGHKAAYLHRSWIGLPLDAPEDELRHRIAASYAIIRAALPKKVQATLAPV